MAKLRLIQAGVGGMGQAWWKGAITGHPDVDVAAIVDINPEPLNEAGDALGVPVDRRFNDLAQAIRAVQADAVLTVTPPAVHIKHAELAFANGLHLLTEKPIGGTLTEAVRMVQMADRADRLLMVAQNYRYSRAAQTLARLVREKPLGEIGHGQIDFYIPGDFRGSFREKMQYPLLVDMAIHHLDLIRAITGRNIIGMTADTFRPKWSWYEHHPGLKMLMRLEGDMPFSYSGDWSARGHCTTWNGAWRLQCAQGCIEYTHEGKIILTRNEFWHEGQQAEEVPLDEVPAEGQRALLDRFVEAVRTNTPPETNGRDNLWSFAAVSAGVLSAEEGRSVNVRELLDQHRGASV